MEKSEQKVQEFVGMVAGSKVQWPVHCDSCVRRKGHQGECCPPPADVQQDEHGEQYFRADNILMV